MAGVYGSGDFPSGLPPSTPEAAAPATAFETPATQTDVDGFEVSTAVFQMETPAGEGQIFCKLIKNGPYDNYFWAVVLNENDVPLVPRKDNKVPDPMASVLYQGILNRYGFRWIKSIQMWGFQVGTEGQWARANELAPKKFPVSLMRQLAVNALQPAS